MIQQKMTQQDPFANEQVEYPALFHFRIITDTEAQAEEALVAVVQGYQVIEALAPSRASAAGRYTAFSVSILMQSRSQMEGFDTAIRKVKGVRMVL